MDTVAHRRNDPTPREERGRQLARERFEDFEMIRPGVWVVPSCSDDFAYLVETKAGTCSCEDRVHRDLSDDPCKHVYAARIVQRQTAICEGCGERFPHREMIECVDGGGSFANHDNLRYFDGDLVCRICADRDGVIR